MTRPRRSLKKRRSEDNIDRRTKSITLEPVPGHRFPLVVIQLCVLIYMCTPCGLRTVVTIGKYRLFSEVQALDMDPYNGDAYIFMSKDCIVLKIIRYKNHK